MNVLVVEDDARSRELLQRYLRAKGHAVATAEDGHAALQSVAADGPDLILLDGNLPVMDGWAVLEALRKFSAVPVIMVTVRDSTKDKLEGLGLGADDYVTKPFDLRELEARILAVMRRYQTGGTGASVEGAGDVVLNDERKEVIVRGQPVAFSPREFQILRLLAARPGRVFSSEEILAAAWPGHEGASAEDVKKYIHMLRRKLERDPGHPRIILTARGFGYRFSPAPGDTEEARAESGRRPSTKTQ